MAYTKTIWEDLPSEDTPATAEALNNMEDGIEDAHTVLGTTSATEIGYVKGVTSAIQTQINASIKGWTDVTLDGTMTGGTITTQIGGANIDLRNYKLVNVRFLASQNYSHSLPAVLRLNASNNYLVFQYNNIIHYVAIYSITSGSFGLTITPASGSNLIQLFSISVAN